MRWKTPQKEINPNDQKLLTACRQGDIDMLQEALNKGAKPDCTEDSGWMPLHLACAHRHEKLVDALLEADANPDLLAKVNGLSPLSVLVRTYFSESTQGNILPHDDAPQVKAEKDEAQKLLRITETLLRFGADPSGCEDIRNPSSPLHIAAKNGDLELAKLLIEYGALMIHGQAQSMFPPPAIDQDERDKKVFPTRDTISASLAPKNTLTPLGVACQAGEVTVMDYLLGILPPQSLESSFVLQQAVQEAQRHHHVDCLVGLWEYSEEVLWLDCERFANGYDAARKNGLVQTFFDIFTESGKQNSGNESEEGISTKNGGDSTIIDISNDDGGTTWLEILQEACRRKSVNLLQPLLMRLPNQDEFFEEIQKEHSSISASLIQAVDRRDHQTLLHRFCAGEEVRSSSNGEPHATPTLSLTAAAWIRRLLSLSRESDEIDLEEMRLSEVASSNEQDLNASKYVALYQSAAMLTWDSDDMEESSDEEASDSAGSSESGNDSYSDSNASSNSEEDSDVEDQDTFGSGVESSSESVDTTQRSHVNRRVVEQPHMAREGPGAGESDSEESYSMASATASESEDDGFRSQASSEQSPEDLNNSFVALPTHSGKNLVNALDLNRQTPLHVACSRGVVAAVEILLEEENVQVNATDSSGNTPLLLSVHPAVISCLLQDKRTDVNATNQEGNTRLHKAIQQDDMPIFQLLLANGANLEITDDEGRTPLYFACAEGSLDICSFLLAHGADPNTKTTYQQDTPLHAACRGGHLGPVLRLFDATVDTKDVDGHTPLHLACFAGHANIVEYLVIECGANLNIQNNEGYTPFELACQAGSADVVYYIVRSHSLHWWKREDRIFSNVPSPVSLNSVNHINVSNWSTMYDEYGGNDDALVHWDDPFQYSALFDPSFYRGDTLHSLSNYEVPSYDLPSSMVSVSYDDPSSYRNTSVSCAPPSGTFASGSLSHTEPFACSSRYRRLLYKDEPIYY